MASGGYAKAGTADFYNAYGEFEWDRLERRAYGRLQAVIHTDFVRQYVTGGQRVLDAGCGPGRFTIELARLGARPVALDTSPGQLDAARARCEAAGVADAVEAFVQGDIVDLSTFDDGTFGAVVCFGGPLSYVLDQRRQAAAELLRVTRPGGVLLMSVMSRLGAICNLVRRGALHILTDPVAGRIASVLDHGDLSGIPSRIPNTEHPPMHLYTAAEVADLLRPCEVLAVAGSNVTAVEGDPLLEDVAADETAWLTAIDLERRLCRQPGLVDTGSHIILAARKPDQVVGR